MDKLKVICKDNADDILETYEEHLNIYNIQYYFPPLSLYSNIDNHIENRKRMKLKTEYYIYRLIDEENAIVGCRDIQENRQVIIKRCPILEPISYIMDKYSNLSSPELPFFHTKKSS